MLLYLQANVRGILDEQNKMKKQRFYSAISWRVLHGFHFQYFFQDQKIRLNLNFLVQKCSAKFCS